MPLLTAEHEADDEAPALRGLLQAGVREPIRQQAASQPRGWPRLPRAALLGAAALLAAGCAAAGALRRGRPPTERPAAQALHPLGLEGDGDVQLRSANGSAEATHGGAAGLLISPEERLDAMRVARKELVQAGVSQSVVIAPLDRSIAQLRASIEELEGAAPPLSPGGGQPSAGAKPLGRRSGGSQSEPRREEDKHSSAAGIWDAAVLSNFSERGEPHEDSGAPAGKGAPGGSGSDRVEGAVLGNSSRGSGRDSGTLAGKEAPSGSGSDRVEGAVLGNSSRGSGRDSGTLAGKEAPGGNGSDQANCSSCGWYRVLQKTIAREGPSLDSAGVAVVKAHTLIQVTRREGRRVQVDVPIKGWMSLRTAKNETTGKSLEILRREYNATDSEKRAALPVRLPNGTLDFSNITKRLELLRQEGMSAMGQKLTDKALHEASDGEKKLAHAIYGIDQGKVASLGERLRGAERSAEASMKDAASTAEQALSTPDPLKTVQSSEQAIASAARQEALKALRTPGLAAQLPGNLTAQLPGNLTAQIPGSLTAQLRGNLTAQLPDSLTGELPGNLTAQLPGAVPEAEAPAQLPKLPKGLKVPTAAQIHEALESGPNSLRKEVGELFR